MPSSNPLLESISTWFRRNFSDPGAISLFFTLVIGFVLIEFFGGLLLPVIISIILTYLLQAGVKWLERWYCPHIIAVLLVFIVFISAVIVAFLWLAPLMWKQLSNLVSELPLAFSKGQGWMLALQQKYPNIYTQVHPEQVITFFRQHMAHFGQIALRYSLITIPSVIQVILYFILVPLLVFFFLKDSKQILQWFSQYMPRERGLVLSVWSEVNTKIGAYVRGRALEIIIVSVVSMISFAILGLQYSVLLGVLVGLSVIVPYIGAVVVTIPVVIIALMQWGLSTHCVYLLSVYTLIIVLDANVLVPLLFSEAMDMHPVVIILAVVIFGGLWGFWGVFFAIPLATLVNAVLHAWPRVLGEAEPELVERAK